MTTKLIKCDNCGVEFWKPEKLIGERNFCCRYCFNEFRIKNSQLYNKEYRTKALKKLLTYAEMRKANGR